jgi:DNA-binding NarL/FixJ family response regulator
MRFFCITEDAMRLNAQERPRSAIRVHLFVQNRLLREALVRLFHKRAGISVAGKSHRSELDIEFLAANPCDVLLLDSFDHVFTERYLEELCERIPQIKIVLFGMDEDRDYFLNAVRLGVSGYLLNDASSEDIIAAVRGVVQGEAVCPPRLCMSLFQCVSREYRQRRGYAEQEASLKLGLTFRQRQLMSLVAKGMTNKEIAEKLSLSQFTVKNHIYRIMKQVEADSRHQAVDLIRVGGFLPQA